MDSASASARWFLPDAVEPSTRASDEIPMLVEQKHEAAIDAQPLGDHARAASRMRASECACSTMFSSSVVMFIRSFLGRKPRPSGRGGEPAHRFWKWHSRACSGGLPKEANSTQDPGGLSCGRWGSDGEFVLFLQTKVFFSSCGATRGSSFGSTRTSNSSSACSLGNPLCGFSGTSHSSSESSDSHGPPASF